MHALGFDHTMNRLDRQQYVTVVSDAISSGKEHNFVQQVTPFQDFGVYDFLSILHYPSTAFALPNKMTLKEVTPRPAGVQPALNSPWNGSAQRSSLSAGDVDAIRALYCTPQRISAAPATGTPPK